MQEVEGQSEVKMFELLIEKSEFTTIGDNLLNIERDKMIQELQQNIARQGMKYEDYLQHMGKTEDEMKEEFSDDAIKRIKTTLIMREIRKVEDIKSTDEEVVEELNTIIQQQPKERQAEVKKQVDTPHYRHYLRGVIETRKTAAFVKEQILSYPEAK
jgi:trigger factor